MPTKDEDPKIFARAPSGREIPRQYRAGHDSKGLKTFRLEAANMPGRRIEDDKASGLISKRRLIQRYNTRKTTLRWVGIIIVAAVIILILVHVIPPLFSKLDIVDTTYRPPRR